MTGRRTAGLIATAAALVLLAPAGTAGADTGLIQVLSPPKLKAAKKVSYAVSCSATCSLTATLTLKLPGPDLGPVTVGPQTLAAGQSGSPYLVLNNVAKKDLLHNYKRARFKTTITATNLDPAGGGASDTVYRVFKFKK